MARTLHYLFSTSDSEVNFTFDPSLNSTIQGRFDVAVVKGKKMTRFGIQRANLMVIRAGCVEPT